MKLNLNLLAAAIVAASSSTSAMAQDSYVSVFGGVANLSDADLTGDVTTPGGTGPQSVEVQSDGGYAFGVAVGRELTSAGGATIRGEVELSYGETDADDVFFSGNGDAAEVNVDGELATTRLFANVIADFDTGSAVTPYVGAGIGASRSAFDIAYGPGVVLDDESNNFSAQLILGASYAFSDDVSLFSDVRFIRDYDVETDRLSPTGALTGVVSDDIDTTNFNIGISYKF